LSRRSRKYQASKEILERLTRRDPDNTDWQRDLSVAHSRVGDMLQPRGDLAAALAEYQAYKAIMQHLTEADPDNSDWLRELSVRTDKVGGVLKCNGRREALAEYQAGKEIMQRLTERDEENSDCRVTCRYHTPRRTGRCKGRDSLAAAAREYQTCKEILQRLTEHAPESSKWQRELFVSHNNVGNVLYNLEQFAPALEEYPCWEAAHARAD